MHVIREADVHGINVAAHQAVAELFVAVKLIDLVFFAEGGSFSDPGDERGELGIFATFLKAGNTAACEMYPRPTTAYRIFFLARFASCGRAGLRRRRWSGNVKRVRFVGIGASYALVSSQLGYSVILLCTFS